MPRISSDWLTLAAEASGSDREAVLRSGISRAYFAAYRCAELYLRRTGLAEGLKHDVEDHRLIAETLQRAGARTFERAAATHLRQLRLLRNRADYSLAEGGSRVFSPLLEDALRRARAVFSALADGSSTD